MPLTALILLLTAAALHTGWNLMVKGAKEKQVLTWWALVVGSLLYLPLIIIGGPIPAKVWPYAVISALVEGVYFTVLIRAYEQSDFSLIYPVARGAAPGLLAVWAMLFLGERPQPAGVAGLALLLLGLMVVVSGNWWSQRRLLALNTSHLVMALGVALCISIYSVIDGAAVKLMDPASYTVLVLGLTGLFVTPVVFTRYGYRSVVAGWRAQPFRIASVGVLMLLAYILVLQAYAIARVSYAGALRELSVVLAAIAGWRWLGESFGAVRTCGAILIFFGILVLAVAG